MADPLDALYYANLAAANYQKETTLNADRRGREAANASFNYARGQLNRSAPLRFSANRNNANARGLLESGQLAQTQGRTQLDYAVKQGRIGEQRKAAIERYNEADANAAKAYEISAAKAQAESFQRGQEQLERNPPAPQAAQAAQPPAYPIPPAQQEAINRGTPPGAGGVVPYEGKGVRVGMRRAAAKKAVR